MIEGEEVKITCFDEDLFTDDLVGSGTFKVSQLIEIKGNMNNDGGLRQQWLQLGYKHNKAVEIFIESSIQGMWGTLINQVNPNFGLLMAQQLHNN